MLLGKLKDSIDILAQFLISRLLGNNPRNDIKCYHSPLDFGGRQREPPRQPKSSFWESDEYENIRFLWPLCILIALGFL